MSKGVNVSQECHIVNALAPKDIAGTAVSDYFSMGDYSHATIILTCGVVTNASTITVEESDDNAGNSTTEIDFKLAQETTAAGDTLGALAWVGDANGFTTGTNNGTIHVIEIDARQLSAGFPYLVVKASSAAANLMSILVILSGPRHTSGISPTAIT